MTLRRERLIKLYRAGKAMVACAVGQPLFDRRPALDGALLIVIVDEEAVTLTDIARELFNVGGQGAGYAGPWLAGRTVRQPRFLSSSVLQRPRLAR